MKILVVSLLRLGDLIMVVPMLKGLKASGHKVHVLTHSQCKGLQNLLNFVDEFTYFDRSLVQDRIGDPSYNMLSSYRIVDNLLVNLNSENFDYVVNVTHTSLSAHLTSIISAKSKVGVSFGFNGKVSFGSEWFKYLNDYSDFSESHRFHYSDIYNESVSSLLNSGISKGYSLSETSQGRRFFKKIERKLTTRHIVIQPMTSDSKKNWGIKNYIDLVELLLSYSSEFSVTVLGSRAEAASLEPFNNISKRCSLLVCDLEKAYSTIKNSDLVITGDTAIKHMASMSPTSILELSIGSSDIFRTGAYKQNSYIIQSNLKCTPCGHRENCIFSQNICASSFDSDDVFNVAINILKNNVDNYYKQMPSEKWALFKTRSTMDGLFYLHKINQRDPIGTLKQLVHREAFRLIEIEKSPNEILPIGSGAYKIVQELKYLFGSIDDLNIHAGVKNFENNLENAKKLVLKLKTSYFKELGKYSMGTFRENVESLISYYNTIVTVYGREYQLTIRKDVASELSVFGFARIVKEYIENKLQVIEAEKGLVRFSVNLIQEAKKCQKQTEI